MENQLISKLNEESNVAFVEFYATWCPHCQRMQPMVEKVKELFAGRAEVYQFDVDKNEEFGRALNVKGLPTFMIFKAGDEVWRCEGEVDLNIIVRKLNIALAQML